MEVKNDELDLSELLKIRREKLDELKERDIDPYEISKFDRDTFTSDILNNFDEMEGKLVSLAGRMMSKRDMGKASFCDVLDRYGRLQLYVRADKISPEVYEDFKKYDIGDIIGIKGEVFKTQKGEISVKVCEVTLLSKSLKPLPDKWGGLKDTDQRYRQRYIDLIVNPGVRNTFEMRSKIISCMRRYLDDLGFMEVETPVLNTIPGGAAARPFITHHNTLGIDMYMRIATELHLKRLIVGGFEKVYEIGRIFRNEGMSIKHNPEFTSIELYEAYKDYEDIMNLTENMLADIAQNVLGTTDVVYQGMNISFARGFERISMIDSVKKYSGLDFNEIKTNEDAIKAVTDAGIHLNDKKTWGDLLNLVFEEKVEEKLINLTFITDYPVEVSPFAKRKKSDSRLTERFELFGAGRELANAFSELNDPIDQLERFIVQEKMRAGGDNEANMMDEDFINALEYAMPPTGGLGIGIDRLVMIMTDSASIRDVLLFPTMKENKN